MYTLGIPNRQYRRTTQVLGPELSNPISYEAHKQDDGFYMFSFPEIDEYEFKDIVLLLKNNGVTTIGADDTLTERNIMKLTDLLKEQGSPDENNLFDELTLWLEKVRANEPVSIYGGGSIAGEKNERTNQYELDIEQMLENFSEDLGQDQIAMDVDSAKDMQENQGLNRMNRDMTPEEEYLKDNPSPGTSSPMVSGDGNTLKIKPKEGDIQSEVTIKQQACSGDLEKCLEDVTISWDSEGPFKLDFEYDDTVIDAQAYDETDVAEYVAKSDDEYYQFILNVDIVSPKFSGDGGAIEDFDWETLRIEVDPRMDPAIRSDFDDPIMERLQKLAGIKNKI